MRKKVIWVINQTAGKPDSGWGERHYYFSKYWIQKGYSVKIISGSYNHLFIQQPKIGKRNFTIEKLEEGIYHQYHEIVVVDRPRLNSKEYRTNAKKILKGQTKITEINKMNWGLKGIKLNEIGK